MKKIFVLGLFVLSILGAGQASAEHEHHAPHNGTLVVFGDEFAHLEFVLDSGAGRLTAYALDGEAENPERLNQKSIEMTIVKIEGQALEEAMPLTLKAVENVLTGETVGDTSEFAVQFDALKSVSRFFAVISDVSIKGGEFKDVEFDFPEGNDHDEDE